MALDNPCQYVWLDNELMPWEEAHIHPMTHALHYGFSVFEGIKAYETSQGPAIFRLNEHTARFFNSAKMVNMTIPFSQDDFNNALVNTLKKNNCTQGYIRPIAFSGSESLGIHAKNLHIHVAIAIYELGKYHQVDENQGMKIITSSYRRNSVESGLLKAKIGGGYINSILASQEAARAGCSDALMLDAAGFVSEISSANIFMVSKGELITPTTNTIFPGITRDTVITLAKDLNIPVVERNITRDELYTADEIFVSGTAAEIAAVSELDGQIIGSGKRGQMTTQLTNVFSEVVCGQQEQYSSWLSHY